MQLAEALTPVREWLVSELAPQAADTLLELGAGPGDTGFAAAAILGEHGRLLSTDFSPGDGGGRPWTWLRTRTEQRRATA